MNTSILERHAAQLRRVDSCRPTLGGLHDEAGKVDEALLPCRVNNPELWFAELARRRRVRQGTVPGLPGPRALPRRVHSTGASRGASGAVSCSSREW